VIKMAKKTARVVDRPKTEKPTPKPVKK